MTTLTTRTLNFSPLNWDGLVVPLTTIFTPTCGDGLIPAATAITKMEACGPEEFRSVWYLNGYYSPGICPSGYTIGCDAWTSNDWTSAGEEIYEAHVLTAGETARLCVPSGYECLAPTSYIFAAMSGAPSTTAAALEIRWKEEDLTLLETHPMSPGVVVTPTPSSGSSSSSGSIGGGSSATAVTKSGQENGSTSTTSGDRQGQETGGAIPVGSGGGGGGGGGGSLTSGAKAGIAVGCTAAGLSFLLALFWFMRRARRRRDAQAVPSSGEKGTSDQDPEAGRSTTTRHELGGQGIVELPGHEGDGHWLRHDDSGNLGLKGGTEGTIAAPKELPTTPTVTAVPPAHGHTRKPSDVSSIGSSTLLGGRNSSRISGAGAPDAAEGQEQHRQIQMMDARSSSLYPPPIVELPDTGGEVDGRNGVERPVGGQPAEQQHQHQASWGSARVTGWENL